MTVQSPDSDHSRWEKIRDQLEAARVACEAARSQLVARHSEFESVRTDRLEKLSQLELQQRACAAQTAENAAARTALDTDRAAIETQRARLAAEQAEFEAARSQFDAHKNQLEADRAALAESQALIKSRFRQLDAQLAQVQTDRSELDAARAEFDRKQAQAATAQAAPKPQVAKPKTEPVKMQVESTVRDLEAERSISATARPPMFFENAGPESQSERLAGRLSTLRDTFISADELPTPTAAESAKVDLPQEPDGIGPADQHPTAEEPVETNGSGRRARSSGTASLTPMPLYAGSQARDSKPNRRRLKAAMFSALVFVSKCVLVAAVIVAILVVVTNSRPGPNAGNRPNLKR